MEPELFRWWLALDGDGRRAELFQRSSWYLFPQVFLASKFPDGRLSLSSLPNYGRPLSPAQRGLFWICGRIGPETRDPYAGTNSTGTVFSFSFLMLLLLSYYHFTVELGVPGWFQT